VPSVALSTDGLLQHQNNKGTAIIGAVAILWVASLIKK
jgi:hypothetical protein